MLYSQKHAQRKRNSKDESQYEKEIKTKRMCQNDASSFSLYNHRFAIFHRV